MTIDVKWLTPCIGVEITGLDLKQALPESTYGEIKQLVADACVIVFRGQEIDDEAHIAFSRPFGPLEVGPNKEIVDHRHREITEVMDVGDTTKFVSLAQHWHTDGSYRAVPGYITIIRALEICPVGGETCFANAGAGYDALPDEKKRQIANLRAIHDLDYARSQVPGYRQFTDEEKARIPPVEHPLVRIHSGTGRKILYVSHHAREIVGMPFDEGRALLGELTEWTTQSRFVYEHKWRRGDVVAWDNRGTLHRVLPYDATKYRRVMHRTAVSGTAA